MTIMTFPTEIELLPVAAVTQLDNLWHIATQLERGVLLSPDIDRRKAETVAAELKEIKDEISKTRTQDPKAMCLRAVSEIATMIDNVGRAYKINQVPMFRVVFVD